MAANDFVQTVEQIYLADMGRPADVDGLAYWATRIDGAGGNVKAIAQEIAGSPEAMAYANGVYGGLSGDALVAKAYEVLFGRAADADGLQGWTGQLASGASTPATIAFDMIQGAQGGDLATVSQMVQSACAQIQPDALASLLANQGGVGHAAPDAGPIPVGNGTSDVSAPATDAGLLPAIATQIAQVWTQPGLQSSFATIENYLVASNVISSDAANLAIATTAKLAQGVDLSPVEVSALHDFYASAVPAVEAGAGTMDGNTGTALATLIGIVGHTGVDYAAA